jgi:photosystem II stability/assembly factor-like uncharacterized protein
MKRLLLLSAILFSHFALHSQDTGNHSTILQSQVFNDGRSVSLVADSGWADAMASDYNLSLRFTAVDGVTLATIPLDFLDTSLSGNPLTEINIHFTDPKTGFLYGYETGYGYLTFLFRTEDGGKTWKRIILDDIGYSSQLSRNDFFMFNTKQGIIISLGNFPVEFHYFLTSDGGKTWQEHQSTLPDKDMMLTNGEDYLKASFSSDGKVTVMIIDPVDYNSNITKTFVLQSSNFGESFHEMK